MKLTVVIPDDSPALCDRPGCDEPWPGRKGRELPEAYRLAGIDERGRAVVRLFCSTACRDLDIDNR